MFRSFCLPAHSCTCFWLNQKVNIRWRAFNFTCLVATSSDFCKWFVIRLVTFHSVHAEVAKVNQLLWHYLHLKYMYYNLYSIHTLYEWALLLCLFFAVTLSVDTLLPTIWNNQSILRAEQLIKAYLCYNFNKSVKHTFRSVFVVVNCKSLVWLF